MEANMRSAKPGESGTADRWRGKWALITGASAGIGSAFARYLAERECNLVLTARRRDRLDQLASQLAAGFGISVEVVTADLALANAPNEIFDFTSQRKIAIQLLVNNAGFGAYGYFDEIDLQRHLDMMQVNCSAVVHLTHLFLPAMLEHGSGDILIVASTAAFQAVPFIGTYAATKAFDLLLGEALFEEYASRGIRVCVLCPGPTTSEFQAVSGSPSGPSKHFEAAEKVARVGLDALTRGKSCVISGTLNNMQVQALRVAPRRIVTAAAARMFRPQDKIG
jgi:short-subunit dehydrogenase